MERLPDGVSVVVERDGVVVAREAGRGVAPLLALLDAGKLRGAAVYDRVIGRAAAAICAVGGVRQVSAVLMSAGAAAFLAEQGIPATAETTAPQIDNRDRTGMCPMERAVAGLSSPVQMVNAVRQTLAELKSGRPCVFAADSV